MLKMWLATMVIEKKITLEKAKEIEKRLGEKPIPSTIEEIIEELLKELSK